MPNRNIRAISNDDMHLRILLGFLISILLRLGSLSHAKNPLLSGGQKRVFVGMCFLLYADGLVQLLHHVCHGGKLRGGNGIVGLFPNDDVLIEAHLLACISGIV